jgi:hypothetical protein
VAVDTGGPTATPESSETLVAGTMVSEEAKEAEAKMKAMNAGDKKDFDQKKYDGYKETYYKNKSVKDSNDAFVKEQ